MDSAVYERARSLVITEQKCSTELLTERLGINYNLAILIIDKLETDGVVGPFSLDHSREVYISTEKTGNQ